MNRRYDISREFSELEYRLLNFELLEAAQEQMRNLRRRVAREGRKPDIWKLSLSVEAVEDTHEP